MLNAVVDAVGGVVQEHANGVRHYSRIFRPARRLGFLHATQRRLDRIALHHDIGKHADDFLLIRQPVAIFFQRRAGHQKKSFLDARQNALFLGPGAGWPAPCARC